MRLFFFSILLLTVSVCFSQVNLNLGLRAYYPFSGNANDISGNNNNPVFNNATLITDRFGNSNSAYHFNGTSTYMRILNSASLNANDKLSLVAWVKPQGFYPGTCHGNSILMKGNTDFLPGNYLLRYDDNAFLNGTQCSVPVDPLHQNFYGGGLVATPPGYLPYIQANQWYCVIATYDGTTARLYVNCQLIFSRSQAGATFTNAADLFIGRFNSGSFPYWVNGDIDDVRIYDRTLNQEEVNVLAGCLTPVGCNNWLNTPVPNSKARVGDLDISGNQLTVEASFIRTGPVNPVGGYGFLVSKHTGPPDVNYAMWPGGCSITTTNGQVFAQENCPFELNRTYHVAMVYDGTSLKYYRDGFLHNSTPITGNLVLNNLITTIGQNVPEGAPTIFPFIGNINEVRIWNVARSQGQIQAYMNAELPTPATQSGLMGYYVFDGLVNKQGNPAYNAVLSGGATINATNPNCTFVADSCPVLSCNTWLKTTNTGDYATVGDLDISGNKITVEANFNKTVPGGPFGGGFLVSKHTGPGNVNYALEPDGCAISTVNGDVLLGVDCYFQDNKPYHVAMVYDGASVKFYRNGFLHKQAPLSGNLALNNFITAIGQNSTGGGPIYPFGGYINEVRIWNVARTQAELQAYMNTTLPNPTTQSGLQGYYVFNNLLNKQGNAAFNATLHGTAAINTTNPICTFVADSCPVAPPLCNNWLAAPAQPAFVTVGDLDIPGTTLTIEATANRTSFLSNGVFSAGDLVSKHSGSNNANYLLRSTDAEISTTNGFFFTPQVCPIELNKTYHYAMVYDGTALKYYRNGVLLSQVPATGNLIQNNLNTTIAWLSGQNQNENFVGYINEVRIWNVARTQAQIQSFMNASLPNPTTQPGLLAYYTFNNLLNKQGNAAWNGTLGGGASINATNPSCTLASEVINAANAGPDTTFCSNTTVSHILQGSGIGTIYSWTPAIYLDNPGILNPKATVSTTTKFYLTVSNPASLCPAIDSVTIYVNPLPTVKTIEDTLICSTQSITLTTTGAQTYSWTPAIFLSDPNAPSPVYSGNQSQTYYVTGTHANGCTAKDTVNVAVNVRGMLKAPPDKNMCSQSSVQLDGFNGNTVSYLWSPGTYLSNTTIINPIANPPASTSYNVKISDLACSYDSNFTVQVIVGTGLVVGIGKSNDVDCANRSATLHASGGDTYLWTPSTGLSDPTSPDPVASPVNTQQYVVHVTNASGCIGEDSITVISTLQVSLTRYMPNAFTPNGDGKNDCYRLKNWLYIKKLQFFIFNIYGEQVFATSNPSACWDGIYKGKQALEGTYVFYIKAETDCGIEEQKGSFLLIR